LALEYSECHFDIDSLIEYYDKMPLIFFRQGSHIQILEEEKQINLLFSTLTTRILPENSSFPVEFIQDGSEFLEGSCIIN
jgi:hypothetical protein